MNRKKAMDFRSRKIQRRISKERALFIFPTINGDVFLETEGRRVVSFGMEGGVVRYVLTEFLSERELGI